MFNGTYVIYYTNYNTNKLPKLRVNLLVDQRVQFFKDPEREATRCGKIVNFFLQKAQWANWLGE